MTKKKLNKTARKTRKKIKEALLKLFKTKKMAEVTVIDIHAETGYSRQTFYRHYKGVEEVVADLITDYFNDFVDEGLKGDKITLHDFMCVFFNFLQSKKELIKILIEAECLMILIELYFSLLLNMMEELLSGTEELTAEERQRENLSVLGVIMSMAYYTFNNNFADTPEQLANYVEDKLSVQIH